MLTVSPEEAGRLTPALTGCNTPASQATRIKEKQDVQPHVAVQGGVQMDCVQSARTPGSCGRPGVGSLSTACKVLAWHLEIDSKASHMIRFTDLFTSPQSSSFSNSGFMTP